jgi:hypothetical protein
MKCVSNDLFKQSNLPGLTIWSPQVRSSVHQEYGVRGPRESGISRISKPLSLDDYLVFGGT